MSDRFDVYSHIAGNVKASQSKPAVVVEESGSVNSKIVKRAVNRNGYSKPIVSNVTSGNTSASKSVHMQSLSTQKGEMKIPVNISFSAIIGAFAKSLAIAEENGVNDIEFGMKAGDQFSLDASGTMTPTAQKYACFRYKKINGLWTLTAVIETTTQPKVLHQAIEPPMPAPTKPDATDNRIQVSTNPDDLQLGSSLSLEELENGTTEA